MFRRWQGGRWLRLLAFVLIGGGISLGYLWSLGAFGAQRQTPRVLRLHVVAASDRPADQALKLAVRDTVLLTVGPHLAGAGSEAQAWRLAARLRSEIRRQAEATVRRFGLSERVSVRLTHDLFPVKSYGNLVLPAGRYAALEVVLGPGQGQNWWCVLFPPLCLVDPDTAVSIAEPKSASLHSVPFWRRLRQEVTSLW